MDENTDAVVAPAAEPEKTLSQSQVNEIVKREKAAAAEKARREAQAEYAVEMERLKTSQAQGMGGMAASNNNLDETVDKAVNAKLEKLQQEAARKAMEAEDAKNKATLEETANKFHLKMGGGKDKFADFDEVMKDFEPGEFPAIAFLAAEMDNTAEIMYELANNPSKVAQLQILANQSVKMARKEMTKLSQSIAQNQQAKTDNVTTAAPLSRLKSSTVGADSGKMGLKDYKNADWLKG